MARVSPRLCVFQDRNSRPSVAVSYVGVEASMRKLEVCTDSNATLTARARRAVIVLDSRRRVFAEERGGLMA